MFPSDYVFLTNQFVCQNQFTNKNGVSEKTNIKYVAITYTALYQIIAILIYGFYERPQQI